MQRGSPFHHDFESFPVRIHPVSRARPTLHSRRPYLSGKPFSKAKSVVFIERSGDLSTLERRLSSSLCGLFGLWPLPGCVFLAGTVSASERHPHSDTTHQGNASAVK